ncbi:MAG: DUF1549 domain-containing protein, partial [Planctomycetaceae bacterium]|nr:DUF1549 domain-containing protein [Planctomycetaceae bacterium]
QQLAGDAVAPLRQQSILGTGFLVAGPWDEVQNVSASKAERSRAHEEQLEEVLGTISQTFLGLTVNCARCHDHKFDPILQADYYRMKAVFDGVDHAEGRKVGNRPFFTPEQTARHAGQLAPLREELAGKKKLLADIESRLPSVAESVEQQGAIVAEGRFGTALNAAHTMAASRSQP